MADLFDKRFIINTGKGGVGKTTISAAIGLAAARRGRRVLVMELGAKDRLARLFGAPAVGTEIVQVEDNLFAVNVTPKSALEEYVVMKLKLRTLYKAVFDNRFIRAFLRVLPGLNELVLLGKAWHEEQARDARTGRHKWDLIVVDAPATGHGIFFLKIPTAISGMISSGPMHAEALKIKQLIEDPVRTRLNLITLVEEMPVNETIELKKQLDDELQIPLGLVVANAVYEPRFDEEQCRDVAELREAIPHDDSPMSRLLDAAVFRNERVELQRTYLERIKNEVDLPLVEIPYYFTERFDFQTISKIADDIDRATAPDEKGAA